MSTDLKDDIQQTESMSLAEAIQASRAFSARLVELLPRFTQNLELLEAGVFISANAHIACYKELSRHQDAYMSLLGMMGHELVYHTAGFFYLLPREAQVLSRREKQAAACVFALIEYMSDMGFSIESMVMGEEQIKQSDLESLFELFKDRLAKIDILSVQSFCTDGLKKLVESGVLTEQMVGEETRFCFAIPIYFYLDIARRVNAAKEEDEQRKRDELLNEFADIDVTDIQYHADAELIQSGEEE